MIPKRYVLFVADGEPTAADWKEFARILEERHGKLKPIAVEGAPRAMVIRTDNVVAPQLRAEDGLTAGGKRVRSVLTSGSIGKLKRRAHESGR